MNKNEDILSLVSQLKECEGDQFKVAFKKLSMVNNETSNVPIYLLVNIISKYKNYDFNYKKAKYYNDNQIKNILSDKSSYEVTYKFMKYCLIDEKYGNSYSANIIDFFKALKFDFSKLCTETIFDNSIDRLLYEINNEDIIFGIALDGHNDNYENLIDVIVNILTTIEDNLHNDYKYEQAKKIELDFDEASNIIEEYEEMFSQFQSYLSVAVSNKRKRCGYKWIHDSKLFDKIIEPWLQSMKDDDKVNIEEVMYIINIKNLTDHNKELLCDAICKISFDNFRNNNIFSMFITKCLLMTSSFNAITKYLETLYHFYSASEMRKKFIDLKHEAPYRQRLLIYYCNDEIKDYFGSNYLDELGKYSNSITSILSPEELELGKLLNKDELEYYKFSNTQIALLKELIYLDGNKFSKDIISSLAVIALSFTDENIEDVSQYILANSKEYRVKNNILYAIVNRKSNFINQLKLNALKDEDYRCRKIAMLLFSDDKSIDLMPYIMQMYIDKSIPIRETCAEIIGRKKYESGIEILFKLLYDKANEGGGGDSDYFSNGINYPVARKAAKAFGQFDIIPNEIIKKIIEFIDDAEKACNDIVVHYELINSISNQKDANILLFFEKLIDNNWIMRGTGENECYSLRYASMWGILRQILYCDAIINENLLQSIYDKAFDIDGRLAGPALIVLGVISKQSIEKIKDIFSNTNISVYRKVLLYGVMMLENPDILNTSYFCDYVNKNVFQDNPLKKLLDYCSNKENIRKDEFDRFVNSDLSIKKWMVGINKSDDINFSIRFILNQIFVSKNLIVFKNEDFRENDLARNIQILNTYSMFFREG